MSRYAADCGPGFSYVGDEHYRGLYNLVNHADQQETKSRMTLMIRYTECITFYKYSN